VGGQSVAVDGVTVGSLEEPVSLAPGRGWGVDELSRAEVETAASSDVVVSDTSAVDDASASEVGNSAVEVVSSTAAVEDESASVMDASAVVDGALDLVVEASTVDGEGSLLADEGLIFSDRVLTFVDRVLRDVGVASAGIRVEVEAVDGRETMITPRWVVWPSGNEGWAEFTGRFLLRV